MIRPNPAYKEIGDAQPPAAYKPPTVDSEEHSGDLEKKFPSVSPYWRGRGKETPLMRTVHLDAGSSEESILDLELL